MAGSGWSPDPKRGASPETVCPRSENGPASPTPPSHFHQLCRSTVVSQIRFSSTWPPGPAFRPALSEIPDGIPERGNAIKTGGGHGHSGDNPVSPSAAVLLDYPAWFIGPQHPFWPTETTR